VGAMTSNVKPRRARISRRREDVEARMSLMNLTSGRTE
jgi:hypothetical protein